MTVAFFSGELGGWGVEGGFNTGELRRSAVQCAEWWKTQAQRAVQNGAEHTCLTHDAFARML